MSHFRNRLLLSTFLILFLGGCIQDVFKTDENTEGPVSSENTEDPVSDTELNDSTTTEEQDAAVSDPRIVLQDAYLCSEQVSGFDTCQYNTDLFRTKSHVFLYSSKMVNSEPQNSISLYADGDFEAYPVIPNLHDANASVDTQFSLDYKADAIVTYDYSEAGVTSILVTTIDTTVSPLKVTHAAVGIPTDEISGIYPVYVDSNVLYGAGKRSSDNGQFLYSVDYNDSANVIVTRLAGLHDGSYNVANWQQSFNYQLRYTVDYVNKLGNILVFNFHPGEDLNYDAIWENSEVYWINLDDPSVGGYYSLGQNVRADRFTMHGGELYFAYASSAQQMWVKAAVSGTGAAASLQFSTVFELSAESPNYLMSMGSTLYAIPQNENFSPTLFAVNTSDYTLGSLEYRFTRPLGADGYEIYSVSISNYGYYHGAPKDSSLQTKAQPVEIDGQFYLPGVVGSSPNDFGVYRLEFFE